MIQRTILLALLLVVSDVVKAQEWVDQGPFPDEETFWRSSHGAAVDAENKVWLSQYYPDPWVLADGDTLRDENGQIIRTSGIYVFNSDGTRADVGPIRSFEFGEGESATADTLFWDAKDGLRKDIRGVRTDHNGDIIVAIGGQQNTSLIFRLNHRTGEVMNRLDLEDEFGSPAAPGIDAAGTMYLAPVVANHPIVIYGANFGAGVPFGGFQGQVYKNSPGIGRTLAVSADGNTVYWSAFTVEGTIKFQREDEFSRYDSIGVVHKGLLAESSVRHPITGHIWLGNSVAGRYDPASAYDTLTWYALDPETDELVDSIKFDLPFSFGEQKTRSIGFSPDGVYAYVGLFDNERDGNGIFLTGQDEAPRGFTFKKFMRMGGEGTTSIERNLAEIPQGFTLSQNYPNPFNPRTNIEFEIMEAGLVLLRIYDILGREVATLVDEHLAAGTYTATFTSNGLPSGTYVYQLDVAGHRLSGKMMLSK